MKSKLFCKVKDFMTNKRHFDKILYFCKLNLKN